MFRLLRIFSFILFALILLHAEDNISAEKYLSQCTEIINRDKNKIRIYTRNNRSIKTEFVRFEGDTLVYFDVKNYCEAYLPLIEIYRIVTKNNNAFDGNVWLKTKNNSKNVSNLLSNNSKYILVKEYNKVGLIIPAVGLAIWAGTKFSKMKDYYDVAELFDESSEYYSYLTIKGNDKRNEGLLISVGSGVLFAIALSPIEKKVPVKVSFNSNRLELCYRF